VRDKDAAVAAILLAECAAKLKRQGRTLRDYLDDIYRAFGYFREVQKSTYREGARGNEEIAQIMSGLRRDPPAEIGGYKVVEVVDRQTNTVRNVQTGTTRTIQGATGNVLAFTFSEEGHTRVTARPSGTEPKIKYYVSASSADRADLAGEDLAQMRKNVDQFAYEIVNGMLDSAEQALKAVAL
jgi:phosphomannomutase